MSLYGVVIFAHSYVRWLVVLLVLAVIVRSFAAWRAGRDWNRTDERLHGAMVGSVDLQFTLGVVLLLFLSPLPRALLADFAQGMKVPALRFFGMEHPLGMLIVTALIHVFRRRAKRMTSGVKRHRLVWSSTLGALLIVVASFPWPGLRHGRPLARGLASPAAIVASDARCPSSYRNRCLACHGVTGRGDGPAAASLEPRPRDFSDASWGAGLSDEQVSAVIRDGGKAHGLSAAMPAHSDLSADELRELVACLRSFR